MGFLRARKLTLARRHQPFSQWLFLGELYNSSRPTTGACSSQTGWLASPRSTRARSLAALRAAGRSTERARGSSRPFSAPDARATRERTLLCTSICSRRSGGGIRTRPTPTRSMPAWRLSNTRARLMAGGARRSWKSWKMRSRKIMRTLKPSWPPLVTVRRTRRSRHVPRVLPTIRNAPTLLNLRPMAVAHLPLRAPTSG